MNYESWHYVSVGQVRFHCLMLNFTLVAGDSFEKLLNKIIVKLYRTYRSIENKSKHCFDTEFNFIPHHLFSLSDLNSLQLQLWKECSFMPRTGQAMWINPSITEGSGVSSQQPVGVLWPANEPTSRAYTPLLCQSIKVLLSNSSSFAFQRHLLIAAWRPWCNMPGVSYIQCDLRF